MHSFQAPSRKEPSWRATLCSSGGLIAGFLPLDIGGLHACTGGFCYYLIPGILGAIIFAFLVRFLMGMNRNRV